MQDPNEKSAAETTAQQSAGGETKTEEKKPEPSKTEPSKKTEAEKPAKPAADDASKKSNTAAAAPVPQPNQESTMKTKSKGSSKKKGAGKKGGAKKGTSTATYPTTAKKCPYREGTMKAKAYAIFAKGGTRESMIAAIVKGGATKNTASSWIQFFRRYVKTGKK